MAVTQLRQYLENGTIHNSVNFPEISMSRNGEYRLTIINSNIPNMVAQISSALGESNLNIVDMINKSRDNIAYTLFDINNEIPQQTLDSIRAIDGVLNVRVIPPKK